RTAWAKWLSVLAASYNSSVHTSTRFSPNFLLFGYSPSLYAGMFKASSKQVERPHDETPQLRSRLAEEFIEELNLYRTAARESLVMAQERQARAYNKGRKPPVEFNVGD
ncbi:hypothetical protein GGF50DRAFT_10546, partial [Schizophyllum commune]